MDPRLIKLLPRILAGDPIAIAITGVSAAAFLRKALKEKKAGN